MKKSWMDKNLPVNKRVELLLLEMELTEKIGQMVQINNLGLDHAHLITEGKIGSALYASSATAGNHRDKGVNPELLNEIQFIAVNQSRLGIPLLFARDVIHGFRTVFPVPLGQAASWSPELVREAARISALEAYSYGLRWTFTPMIDIARDPRWGRITEGFGEDPMLCSELAAAAVKGYQGKDLSDEGSIAACVKHFVAYGGAEGGRDYNTVDIGSRSLHDTYLPPFEACVRAGASTLMAAFNEIDGVPSTANENLLRNLLKESWGFDGLVVSDWDAVAELRCHGIAKDKADAAYLALKAGIDIEMVSTCYSTHLEKMVLDKKVPMEWINDAVSRILSLKFKLGLFEKPYSDKELASQVILKKEHRAHARKLAHESMVLLKNNGILPLSRKEHSILLTGPFVKSRTELFGTWTLDGRSEETESVESAFKSQLPVHNHLMVHVNYTDELIRSAQNADVVIACIGEHPSRSGEANSISNIDLPPGQLEYLKEIHEMKVPIIAVVFAGRPLSINWLAEHADAILYVWHPGIEGAQAICDIIYGKSEPGGRLPVTFPRSVGQIPLYYNHKSTGRPLPSGERRASRYNDSLDCPLYPFGFGLSYGRFFYSDLEIAEKEVKITGKLCVKVKVTNVGTRKGEEVVQLYVHDVNASITRPVKELKGFQRVTIEPGDSKTVEFQLSALSLSFTNRDGIKVVEPGEFKIWLGPNSQEGLADSFSVIG